MNRKINYLLSLLVLVSLALVITPVSADNGDIFTISGSSTTVHPSNDPVASKSLVTQEYGPLNIPSPLLASTLSSAGLNPPYSLSFILITQFLLGKTLYIC